MATARKRTVVKEVVKTELEDVADGVLLTLTDDEASNLTSLLGKVVSTYGIRGIYAALITAGVEYERKNFEIGQYGAIMEEK